MKMAFIVWDPEVGDEIIEEMKQRSSLQERLIWEIIRRKKYVYDSK